MCKITKNQEREKDISASKKKTQVGQQIASSDVRKYRERECVKVIFRLSPSQLNVRMCVCVCLFVSLLKFPHTYKQHITWVCFFTPSHVRRITREQTSTTNRKNAINRAVCTNTSQAARTLLADAVERRPPNVNPMHTISRRKYCRWPVWRFTVDDVYLIANSWTHLRRIGCTRYLLTHIATTKRNGPVVLCFIVVINAMVALRFSVHLSPTVIAFVALYCVGMRIDLSGVRRCCVKCSCIRWFCRRAVAAAIRFASVYVPHRNTNISTHAHVFTYWAQQRCAIWTLFGFLAKAIAKCNPVVATELLAATQTWSRHIKWV